MRTNVKPLLRFFFEVIMTDEVRRWLIPDGQSLKEGRWLRIVGWLMSEDVFLISKKTVMALFLNESAEMEMVATLDSTRMLLGKRLTSNRKQYFEKVLKQYLKTIK